MPKILGIDLINLHKNSIFVNPIRLSAKFKTKARNFLNQFQNKKDVRDNARYAYYN